jgi:predicted RNA-binding protein YlxR (DUF448 family)
VVRASVFPASKVPQGPVRTCIGCRERAAKSELVRVTAGSDADGRPVVVPDPVATRRGRGAHLHPTTACYDLAVRRRAFASALRADAGLDSAPVASYLASLSSTTDQPPEKELEQ